jgi:hypothetical protein
MRLSSVLAATALLAASAVLGSPQEAKSTATYDLDTHDVNGNPMPGLDTRSSRSDGDSSVYETRQSLNGTTVPAERVEQHVVRDSGGVRVVERLIQRYSPNGEPLPREKQTITTTTHADGSVEEQSDTWRGDLNGNLALAERTETETRRNGSTVNSETVVSRPSLNDSLDVVEKRDVVRDEQSKDAWQQNETVWRNGQSGFYEAVRRVTEHRAEDGRVSENTAEYEPGNTGALVLHSQIVKNSVKAPDGSERTEITVRDQSAPGRVIDGSDPGLKLHSEEIVERVPGADGSVRETVSVRRPSVSEPDRLGPARRISETVCRGNCSPPPQP